MDISLSPIATEQGLFFASALRDITFRKQAELKLRIAATAFESQESMVITNANSVILQINKAFTESTGYTAEEVVGKKMNLLSSGVHDKAFYDAVWECIERNGSWQGEIWDQRKNGEHYKTIDCTVISTAIRNPFNQRFRRNAGLFNQINLA